jgi:hypothetical protein
MKTKGNYSCEGGGKTFIVLSADPVANHSFVESKAIDRTHPKCPDNSDESSHCGCQSGTGILAGIRRGTIPEESTVFSTCSAKKIKYLVAIIIKLDHTNLSLQI